MDGFWNGLLETIRVWLELFDGTLCKKSFKQEKCNSGSVGGHKGAT